ncbi:hypothetical protein SE17_28415 [Kouleothrix aurantiaca]|uniref:Uncharacterized protein n=1 Tax=Kouleothrix aurantiaca TaxID=186479 RepID=A0A0P9DK59_9CHLR|nr:hypothetical protein SE17_28415 [Kouleothrix aurantiaca]
MEQEYTVITLTQPWATLVAIGAKQIETRSWATTYRGPLLIHAAQGLGPGGKAGLRALVEREPFNRALCNLSENGMREWWGKDVVEELPRGAIVARCDLLDCIPTHHPNIPSEPGKPWFMGARAGVGQHYYEVPPPLDSNEYAFGDYTPGRYAWLLSDVQALSTPIPAKGQLGLWTWRGALPA